MHDEELDASPLLRPPSGAYAVIDGRDDRHGDVIRTGAWDAELFYPFESWTNCYTTCVLPCVSLAQISQRIGWAPYWKVLHTLLIVYEIEIFLAAIAAATIEISYHEELRGWLSTLYQEHPRWLLATAAGSASASAVTCFSSISGLAITAITLSLRGRVRAMFQIPGSVVDDIITSSCCSCCAIVQMATHVKSYKRGVYDIGPVDTLPGYQFGGLPTHYNHHRQVAASAAARKQAGAE